MRRSRMALILAVLAVAATARAYAPAASAAGQDKGWKGIAGALAKPGAKPPAKAAPAAKPPDAKKEAAIELAPMAKGAFVLMPDKAVRPLREVLAPFAKAILLAGPKYADAPGTFRVVFEVPDGEFLELEMAWDEKTASVLPSGASAVSRGRDRAALEAFLKAYAEAWQ